MLTAEKHKKKEKSIRFRKSLLKKKKNLHLAVVMMQIFLHICGDRKGAAA